MNVSTVTTTTANRRGILVAGAVSGVLAGGAKAIGNAISSGKLEIGKIQGIKASKGYWGVRYKTAKGPAYSMELHGSHNTHTHLIFRSINGFISTKNTWGSLID